NPSTVNTPRNWTITVGALRSTLPTALPTTIASELAAPNANSPNISASSHNSVARNCCRSSKRKNSKVMSSPRSGRVGLGDMAGLLAQALEIDVLQVRGDLLEALLRPLRREHVDHRVARDQPGRQHGVP